MIKLFFFTTLLTFSFTNAMAEFKFTPKKEADKKIKYIKKTTVNTQKPQVNESITPDRTANLKARRDKLLEKAKIIGKNKPPTQLETYDKNWKPPHTYTKRGLKAIRKHFNWGQFPPGTKCISYSFVYDGANFEAQQEKVLMVQKLALAGYKPDLARKHTDNSIIEDESRFCIKR